MAMKNACMLRLEDPDSDKLQAAADDMGITRHEMARLIVLNYLAGWQGPYVLRRPLNDQEPERQL